MKTMKTYTTKPSHVESRWHVFDATDKILGRLATEVAVLLQGKHKPIFARHILTGDYVIVVNASRIKVTGKKLEQKLYRSHSNYPGGLRETRMSEVQANHPDRILRAAVRGMLPKNILGRHMLRRLKVYAGETHPHEAQVRDSAGVRVQDLPAEPERPALAESPKALVEELAAAAVASEESHPIVQAQRQSMAESNGESTGDKAVS